mgnify:FL=1
MDPGKKLNPTVFKLKDTKSSSTSFPSFLRPVGTQDLDVDESLLPSAATRLEDRPIQEEVKEDSTQAPMFGGRRARHMHADGRDPVTLQEIFDIIRRINDPEHPLTLEQLNVVQLDLIEVDDVKSRVHVKFTPTIPHCSMATLIGLSITTKLIRSLPIRFKISVNITPGTHNQEHEVNKQLNDKERVAAALENKHLLQVVDQCIAHTDGGEKEKEGT